MTFTQFKNRWQMNWYRYRLTVVQFTTILDTIAQQDDLKRLVRWARRKKLKSVQEHYQWRLIDAEQRLLTKTLRHPQLTSIAKWVYCAQVMLSATPRFYPKGAAAKYRLRN